MADVVMEPGAAPAAPRFAPVSASYGRYALALLVAIYTVNFLDRQIITTIGESIKNDLHLTDSQMGALGGIFFAAVYTILGIPIARVADKQNRPWVMTISLALWIVHAFGWGRTDWHRLAAGTLVGPRIVSSGPYLEGTTTDQPHLVVRTPAEARHSMSSCR